MLTTWGLLCLLSSLSVAIATEEDLIAARDKVKLEYERSGFQWMTPAQYHNMDKTNNTKPYMFQFLSSRCWLCRGLLDHMATKEDPQWISNLSAQFNAVMIFDGLGWEYVSPDYTPEGMNYVPRCIFAWPNGTMRHDLQSKNAGPENQFYFLSRELLFQMWQILQEQNKAAEPYPSDLEDDLPS